MTSSRWFRQRTLRVPTWRSVLVGLAGTAVLLLLAVLGLHPFLARSDRAPDADLLVVEGWLPDYAIAQAVAEFQRGRYRHVYTTGGPVTTGSHLSGYETWAGLAQATARELGVPDDLLSPVPARPAPRGRTFVSAWSLRHKLERDCQEVHALQIYTLGAHARRTRMAYQRVFGDEVTVGVVAVPSRAYDPARWWASSAGLKEVVWQTVSWAYEWIAGDRTAPPAPNRCGVPEVA